MKKDKKTSEYLARLSVMADAFGEAGDFECKEACKGVIKLYSKNLPLNDQDRANLWACVRNLGSSMFRDYPLLYAKITPGMKK